ncbi:MAG: glycosyltransferase [Candidatus Aenigmarchaeota archaeon]|nr:glycosyltransferase [Candidatus Aenigmarchaeota archaeon]
MKVLMVSSWDRKICGVKFYSQNLVKALEKLGVEIIKFPSETSWLYWSKLFKRVKKENPEIIHIQHAYDLFNPFGLLPFYIIAKLKKWKVVTTLHNALDFSCFEKNYEKYSAIPLKKFRVYRKLRTFLFFFFTTFPILKFSKTVILHSRKSVSFFRKYGRADFIPHGTELNFRKPPPRTKFIFLSFGMITRKKRYDIIFKAIRKLKKVKYIVHISVCKDKKWFFFLKRNSPSDVQFIERIISKKKLLDLISSSHVVVIPYEDYWRGGSGVFHDALSVGRPVIMTRTGEFEDWQNFFPTFTLDVKSVTNAILEIRKNYEKYVKRARKLAINTSWNKVAKLTKNLYEKLLENKS